MTKRTKTLINTLINVVITVTFVLIIATVIIDVYSVHLVYEDIEKVPHNKVGLVLGTSPYLRSGEKNPYFEARINAAAELYYEGKVDALLLSGDNSTLEYNEPIKMKKYLAHFGIPDSVIYLDYAGFRTLDAVVRCKEIFGQDSFTVVSQDFHTRRAVFIASFRGIHAVAYNAESPKGYTLFSANMREAFARVKVFIDLLFNKQPKFLGEKIKID